jgi:hypothetical protein
MAGLVLPDRCLIGWKKPLRFPREESSSTFTQPASTRGARPALEGSVSRKFLPRIIFIKRSRLGPCKCFSDLFSNSPRYLNLKFTRSGFPMYEHVLLYSICRAENFRNHDYLRESKNKTKNNLLVNQGPRRDIFIKTPELKNLMKFAL